MWIVIVQEHRVEFLDRRKEVRVGQKRLTVLEEQKVHSKHAFLGREAKLENTSFQWISLLQIVADPYKVAYSWQLREWVPI